MNIIMSQHEIMNYHLASHKNVWSVQLTLTCSQVIARFYLATVEIDREKAWYHYYITDQKW